MAKISITGNFNFDSDIDDQVAAEVIKIVIERQYAPKTDKALTARKRHIHAVDSNIQPDMAPDPEESEPP